MTSKALQGVYKPIFTSGIICADDAPESPSVSPPPARPYNAYGKLKRSVHSRQ